ncbi:hypothetical protein BGZ47_006420, partial [Haplosporangium gracile]
PEGSDTVNIRFARVPLTIKSDKTNTAYIPEQKARLIVADYNVRTNFLTSNADNLANRIPVVHVRDFIDFFASPKVPSQDDEVQRGSTSCFKTRPFFRNQQTIMSWIL